MSSIWLWLKSSGQISFEWPKKIAMPPKKRKAAELPQLQPGAAEPGRLTECLGSIGNREAIALVAHTVSVAAERRSKREEARCKKFLVSRGDKCTCTGAFLLLTSRALGDGALEGTCASI